MLKKVKFHSHRTFIFLKKKGNMIFSKANLFKLKKALLSLEEIPTKEGIVLVTDTDDLTVGLEVFVDGDEGLEPTPDGEYTVGESIVTVEGGKIISIVEKPIEQPTEETPTEETPMEQVETVEEQPTEETPTEETPTEEPIVEGSTTDELNAIIDEQKAMIEQLKAEIETIKSENEELKKKLEEPSAQSAEEDFKNQKPNENEKKIDFSKYIKRNK